MSAADFSCGVCLACGRGFLFRPQFVPSLRVSRSGGRWRLDENGQREPVCQRCVEAANAVLRDRGAPELVVVPGTYFQPDPQEVAEKMGRAAIRELAAPVTRTAMRIAVWLGFDRWREQLEAVVREHPKFKAYLDRMAVRGVDVKRVIEAMFDEARGLADAQQGGEIAHVARQAASSPKDGPVAAPRHRRPRLGHVRAGHGVSL